MHGQKRQWSRRENALSDTAFLREGPALPAMCPHRLLLVFARHPRLQLSHNSAVTEATKLFHPWALRENKNVKTSNCSRRKNRQFGDFSYDASAIFHRLPSRGHRAMTPRRFFIDRHRGGIAP
jgi:hypothetical protein